MENWNKSKMFGIGNRSYFLVLPNTCSLKIFPYLTFKTNLLVESCKNNHLLVKTSVSLITPINFIIISMNLLFAILLGKSYAAITFMMIKCSPGVIYGKKIVWMHSNYLNIYVYFQYLRWKERSN